MAAPPQAKAVPRATVRTGCLTVVPPTAMIEPSPKHPPATQGNNICSQTEITCGNDCCSAHEYCIGIYDTVLGTTAYTCKSTNNVNESFCFRNWKGNGEMFCANH